MFCRPQNTQLGSAENARRGSGDPPGVFCRWLGRENAPHREYGFGYLDAVREVFSVAPKENTDPVPEQIGTGPYDRAYKRHVDAGNRPGGWSRAMLQRIERKVEGGFLGRETWKSLRE